MSIYRNKQKMSTEGLQSTKSKCINFDPPAVVVFESLADGGSVFLQEMLVHRWPGIKQVEMNITSCRLVSNVNMLPTAHNQ